MAEELGVAVLRVTADTREALAALEVLRNAVNRGVGGNFDRLFDGLEDSARKAGNKAGNALARSFKQASRVIKGEADKLKFTTGFEALSFNPTNTVRGLREYADALRRLFDTTELGTEGSQRLADRIGAVESAISRARQTTAQATDTQRQFNAELEKAQRLRLKDQQTQTVSAGGAGTVAAAAPATITQEAKRAASAVQLLQEQLTRLQSPVKIDFKNLERLGESATAAGVEVQRFTLNVINGDTALSTTIAGLQEQARAFTTLAANVKTTGKDINTFTNLTQAAAKALQKELFTGFPQLEALRKLFELGRGTGGKDSFKGTDDLLKFNDRFKATPASIGLYISALEEAKNVTSLTSDSFQLLTAEIVKQRAALDAATRSAEAYARIQQLTAEQRKSVADSFIQASRSQAQPALPSSELLAQRVGNGTPIVRLETTGLNLPNQEQVAALKQSVEEARKLAAAERQAQGEQTQLNAALEAGLRVMQTMVGVIDEQVQGYKFENEQLADILSKQRQLRALEAERSKDARTRLAAEAKDKKSRLQAADDRRQDIRARGTEERIQQALARRQLARDLRDRGKDATGSALIGGAFPLLFGQGLGASIGGGLGGAAGGLLGGQFGFGLSLIGTAVGQLFDNLSKRSQELATALQDPIKNLETLRTAFVFSSRAQEDYVKALLDSGQAAKAEQVVRAEVATTNDPALINLLNSSTEKLNRSWSDLSDRLGGFVAGPASAFNNWLAEVIKLVGGVPARPVPVTGPEAARNARDNSLRGGALLTTGLGLGAAALALGGAAAAAVPTGGASLAAYAAALPTILGLGAAATATGVGSAAAIGAGIGQVDSAERQRLVAEDTQVIALQERLRKIADKRLEVERQIVQAKLQGKTAVAEQLGIESKILSINADFIQKVSANEQAFAAGTISSEEATRRQNDLVEAARAQKVEIAAQAAASARDSRQQLRDARELVGVYGTQRRIKEEQQKIDAAQRANTDAQAVLQSALTRGASTEDIEIYRQAAEKAANDLNRIQREGQENIRRLDTERWANAIAAANQIKSIQEQTAILLQSPNLTGTGVRASQSLAAFNAARREEQAAQARLRIEPGNEQLLQAAQTASELVRKAAAQTRTDLIAAYNAAKDSVREISRSIEDGVLALQQLQNASGQGVNEFLSPQQVTDRQQQVAAQQIPVLQGLVQEFARRTGIQPNFQINGTLEQRNATRSRAIAAFRQELRSGEDLAKLQNVDLVLATNDLNATMLLLNTSGVSLAQTLPQLLTSFNNLISKDWAVQVNVGVDGSVRTGGDVLAGAM